MGQMKKTYVWVYVADPKNQFVSEVYGPCNEQMLNGINKDLKANPLQGFSINTVEVLCIVNKIAPKPLAVLEFDEAIFLPIYYECLPVAPLKIRKASQIFIRKNHDLSRNY